MSKFYGIIHYFYVHVKFFFHRVAQSRNAKPAMSGMSRIFDGKKHRIIPVTRHIFRGLSMHAEISDQVDKVSNHGPLYDPPFVTIVV